MERLNLVFSAMLFLTLSSAASAEGDATRGESSYNSNCAGCHRVAASIAEGLNSETNASAQIDSFLSTHYAPDADIRADIIAYLKSLDGA